MREFTCEELDAAAFDAFSATHPQGNFQQSSRMSEVRRSSGVEVTYLGVREGGALVAAGALELHRSRLSTFAEIHDGPLCDFHDQELTTFFFAELRDRAKAAGAAQLAITPELPLEIRDSEGRPLPLEQGKRPASVPASAPAGPQMDAFNTLTGCGFIHSGFDREYTAVPRWRYVKDLSPFAGEQELLASYAKNTRRNVRIAENGHVSVARASREDLPTFHAICQLSCEKQGFDNRPLEYFQLLHDCLGDKATFYIATIDTVANLRSWEEKRDGFVADIERLERAIAEGRAVERSERQLKDARGKLEAAERRIDEARRFVEEDGEHVPAAAALFVDHPRERVYLFSGSNPKYAKFYAATAIQHRAMTDCLEMGVNRYNFYGINGIFDDPSDPGRGLLEFKQGFSGYVEEMMGSFTLPTKPATYALKQLVHKVLDR